MGYEFSRLDFVHRSLSGWRLRQAPHVSLLDLCHTHQVYCGAHQTHIAKARSTACSTVTSGGRTAGMRTWRVGPGDWGSSSIGGWQDIVALGRRSLLPRLDVVLDGLEHNVVGQG